MELLETQKELALSNPMFVRNHEIRHYAVYFQLAVTMFVFIISFIRPWGKKKAWKV
ncbi:hypothetical protein [Anoxybacillus kestanbolensis]|uniref:hypothetical protein n=1 Tax=Anoxybacillus kestanbolensis TaxID=227476 RepID=UPI001CF7707D|nr:hypothetical protein [Anoxybacillus kestanbolensis]